MRWWGIWQNWWQPATLGQRGERAAARFLRRRGYRILARSQRTRGGEIDLIALTGTTIVFVEVKTRRSAEHGEPTDAVDGQKQRRVIRAALSWLRRKRLTGYPARFDVVSVLWPNERAAPRIEHIQAAFDASDIPGM